MNKPVSADNAILSEEQFVLLIDKYRSMPGGGELLMPFLREQHACYRDKSANTIVRMRGYVLFSFTQTGLPQYAIPFVFDELENGRDAYLVGAAAAALRHYPKKYPEMPAALLTALQNIRQHDAFFSFDQYYQQYPLQNKTSALNQILLSLQWLGSYAINVIKILEDALNSRQIIFNHDIARLLTETITIVKNDPTRVMDCCLPPVYAKNDSPVKSRKKGLGTDQLFFEDHNVASISYNTLFLNNITLVAFFYTRCDNPLKCSLTITNLAAIQRKLREKGASNVQIAAITYDPFYDSASRLKTYGLARGLSLDESARMLRVVSPFSSLEELFDLGVNFTGQVVNRHAIELFVVGVDGRLSTTFRREKINVEKVVDALMKLRAQQMPVSLGQRIKTSLKSVSAGVTPVLVLFLPKCPFCFAAYLSLFGIAGTQFMLYYKYLLPAIVLITAINIFVLYRMGKARNSFLPLYLCVAGAILVIVFGHLLLVPFASTAGFLLLAAGALMNSLPVSVYLKMKYYFIEFWRRKVAGV